MQETEETRVRYLGSEDPLEEKMATFSSILTSRIPWIEEPGGLQSMHRKELDMNEHECTCDSPVRLCNFLQDKKASKCPNLGLNLGFLCSKPCNTLPSHCIVTECLVIHGSFQGRITEATLPLTEY